MILSVDVETTGLDPENDRIVEIGYVLWNGKSITDQKSILVNPCIPIPPEASAVHHITNEMVAKAPVIEQLVDCSEFAEYWSNAKYIIGHNINFDVSFLEKWFLPVPKTIDTLRLTQRIKPDLPADGGYKLQSLRYRYNLIDSDEVAHRAKADALAALRLLIKLMEWQKADIDAMYELARKPIYLKRFPFGKYANVEIDEILATDKGYIYWLFSQDWFDGEYPDLSYSIKARMKGRQTK